MAIDHQLPPVVKRLCEKGANMNLMDNEGNCPLWQALEQNQEDIASILVCVKTLHATFPYYTLNPECNLW